MYVCNKEVYGFLPVPLRAHSSLQDEAESFMHTQLEVMGEWDCVPGGTWLEGPGCWCMLGRQGGLPGGEGKKELGVLCQPVGAVQRPRGDQWA